jgi:Fe-S-cluster containining protein
MPSKDFKCEQCGKCCRNIVGAYCTSLAEEDIVLWRKEGRDDILEWVRFIPLGPEPDQAIADAWFNPRTGDEVKRCPWLRKLPHKNKYICRIHDVKPKHCRDYPTSNECAGEAGCISNAKAGVPEKGNIGEKDQA